MSETKSGLRERIKFLVFLAVVALIICFAVFNSKVSGSILLVALGFGAVIMIHEFGHFIVAKLSGIKVEAFSIGFPPTLLGIRKENGKIRVRFLPGSSDYEGEDVNPSSESDGTEYRLGLIPFGGFVKMMGQSDSGAVEVSDDPRSYLNKPIIVRVGVVAAGVIFNAISAVLIFMAAFLVGVDLIPAVVGGVRPNSPAETAGIKPGDRIVEINGDKFVDFLSYSMTTMLSGEGEAVELKVEHRDGLVEEFSVVAEKSPGAVLPGGRDMGIYQAQTLRLADLSPDDSKWLYKTTELLGSDKVVGFNGVRVSEKWHLDELVENALGAECVLTVERLDSETGEVKQVEVELGLFMRPSNDNFKTSHDLAHIYSMVPRLKVAEVFGKAKSGAEEDAVDEAGIFLEVGDIIVKTGGVENPTFRQLREITTEHKDKELAITVLRYDEKGKGRIISGSVTPRGGKKVTIGIVPALDTEHPVVGQTIDIENGPVALEIPAGATIEMVDGEEVSDFYDVVRIICGNRGQRISIDYRLDEERAGAVCFDVGSYDDFVTVKTGFAVNVPFGLLKETYKAGNPFTAIGWGFKKAKMFIVQTLVTLKRLATQDIGKEALSGPVGIVSISYKIVATQSLTYYIYFLGLISSVIAVMNLLPMPIVDGGVIVLLIIEKIKGSPVSQKVMGIINYVGLVLIITLFVWLTYNDVQNMLSR